MWEAEKVSIAMHAYSCEVYVKKISMQRLADSLLANNSETRRESSPEAGPSAPVASIPLAPRNGNIRVKQVCEASSQLADSSEPGPDQPKEKENARTNAKRRVALVKAVQVIPPDPLWTFETHCKCQ